MERIGKYEILGELGQGGMGAVYRGRDSVIGRDVAIKIIHEQALGAPEIKKRFYREARSAGRLAHENITVIYDIDEADGTPFLVMEYLDGEDLRTRLDRGAALSNEDKLSIAVQMASGLQYAHEQGIIHRDIKPANIRILPNGRVKIMDFGIARIQNETQALTQTNLSLGTPRYMSPEQINGEDLDRRSDLFSYGVLLYELFTGQNPFMGDHVTTIIYKILHANPPPLTFEPGTLSDQLQPIVERCLAKDRDARYPDCAAVLDALLPLVRQAQTAAIKHDETIALPHASALDQTMLNAATLISRPRPDAMAHAPTAHAPTAHASTAHAATPKPPKRIPKKRMWAALGFVLTVSLTAAGYFAFRSPGADPAAEAIAHEAESLAQNLAAPLDSVDAAAESLVADDSLLPNPQDVPATTPTQDDAPARRTADRERSAMDNARQRVVSRRNEAAVATLFQRAEQVRSTANQQYNAGRFAEASRSFQSARQRYEAIQQTPNAYAAGDFSLAATRFGEADQRYQQAAAIKTPEAAVHSLTERYKTSFQREDLATLERVFHLPTSTWKTFFDVAENVKAIVNPGTVLVSAANRARVKVSAGLSYTNDGKINTDPLPAFAWVLEYDAAQNDWVIAEVINQ